MDQGLQMRRSNMLAAAWKKLSGAMRWCSAAEDARKGKKVLNFPEWWKQEVEASLVKPLVE